MIDKIIMILKSIYDPENQINIYELGFIYDIKVDKHGFIKIIMTLTTPNCPVIESLPNLIKEKIKTIKEVKDVDILLTFNPSWNSSLLSEEARLELGLI